jgi:hypothetical protein
MKPKRMLDSDIVARKISLLFLAIMLALAACTPTINPSLQSRENLAPTVASDRGKTIFFPRQVKTEGERAVMQALTRGTLVLVDNCIRLERGKSLENYLLIWPPDFNLSIENGTIEILNEDGETVAHIGDRVRIGGGEVHSLVMLDKFIQEQVPSQCTGPYWIIGDEFTTVDQSK